jgi:membrane AbrB-like protein
MCGVAMRKPPSWRVWRFWLVVVLAMAVALPALLLIRVPSPTLLAGVLAGGVCALSARQPQPLPKPARDLALGLVGVVAGSHIDYPVLEAAVRQPLVILGSVVATLALTIGLGQLLRLSRHVDRVTAVFSSIAGGASGLIVIAKELGADSAIVAASQYLRVFVIVLTIPIVAQLFGSPGGAASSSGRSWKGFAFTVLALLTGLLLARLVRFSGSRLLLPLVAASAYSMTGWFPAHEVPAAVAAFASMLIGLMVGLELTRETIRRLRAVMPLAIGVLVVTLGGSALLGLAFSQMAHVSSLAGYLAMTPGGLPAITVIGASTGNEIGIIMTVQVVRLIMAVFVGVLIGVLIKRQRRSQD